MDIDQLIGKFYNRLKKADIAGTEGKVAVQFNLTGKITGVFYIEILNGNVSGEGAYRQAGSAGCYR